MGARAATASENKGVLTVKRVEALIKHPPAETTEIKDGLVKGLSLRAGRRGKPVWTLRYRHKGTQQRRVLDVPPLRVAEARRVADEALERLRRGDDPFPPADEHRERTVAYVAARYFEYLGKAEKRSADEIERMLRVDLLGQRLNGAAGEWKPDPENKHHLRDRLIGAVDRRDIRDIRDAVYTRASAKAETRERARAKAEKREPDPDAWKQAGAMANRVHAAIRRMFGWAVDEDFIEENPCLGMKQRTELEVRRDRVLLDDELKAVWNACVGMSMKVRSTKVRKITSTMTNPIGDVTRLLLLTGQRLGEVAAMTWGEVLDEHGAVSDQWRLAADRTKNGRAHTVPLTAEAQTIIKARPRIEGCPYVFTTNGKTPVSGFSKFKAELDDEAAIGVPWRIHDLRRTVSSGMAHLRIPPHVIEAVLNHASGVVSGVAAVYNRYQYLEEKAHALQAWASHVDRVLNPPADNVEELRAQASA